MWDSFDQIDFDKLPARFVLKTNHASGQILVCKDKSSFDKKAAKRQFDRWMRECYPSAYLTCELHYRDIPRKIVAEEYLEQLGGNPDDYKFYCFNGKVGFCQAVRGRDLQTHKAFHLFFDSGWNKLGFTNETNPPYEKEFEKPKNFEKMLEFSERLSADFCFVRVDFYNLDGNIYFGELTFTPDSGGMIWQPEGTNEKLGAILALPKEKYILPPRR